MISEEAVNLIESILKSHIGEKNTPELRDNIEKEITSKVIVTEYEILVVCNEMNNQQHTIKYGLLRVSVNYYSPETGNRQVRREISLDGSIRGW